MSEKTNSPYQSSYSQNEVGKVYTHTTGESVLRALSLPTRGRIYDLGIERYRGMPVHPMHPPFEVIGYRSPAGLRNEGDQTWMESGNSDNMRIMSEVIFGTMHTGTHIDSLAHITCGIDDHWYGGHTADESLGDRGPMKADGSKFLPIVSRGVLLDVPKYVGLNILPSGYGINCEVIQGTAESQGVSIQQGDTVLLRTGYLTRWPRPEAEHFRGSGLTHDGAQYLSGIGVINVGADNESLEQVPTTHPTNPHPVHTHLLVEEGIHIMEFVNLEQLAADSIYEFLFVAAPLTVKNATGSMINPLALC